MKNTTRQDETARHTLTTTQQSSKPDPEMEAIRKYTQESIKSLRQTLAEREKTRPKTAWQRFWYAIRVM
ncbi:hypothetical protein CYJ48_10380 [Corynebacterium riegelii]|nr:hypothetical protein CYJ48_10380 [Corynebacterium riegelii]